MIWKDIKESKPIEPGRYLISYIGSDGNQHLFIGVWVLYGDSGVWHMNPKVTHWAEIPQPPTLDNIH